jgi:hypothetical protein
MDFNARVSSEWNKNLADEVLRDLKREIKGKLERTSCPEHGSRPNVRVREVGSKIHWEVINPCCEKLEAAVDLR